MTNVMTREEKAKELAYKYFPNEENIWARDNVEAAKTIAACMEMSNFIIDKARDWLEENVCNVYNYRGDEITVGFIEQFKKAIQ